MTTETAKGERLPTLQDVSKEQWDALAQRRIFFGHQSVGGNIMDGVVSVLREHPDIPLTVLESRPPQSNSRPAFYHALIGRNEFPMEKLDDFVSVSTTAFGENGGIAMVKLCYVDITGDTDPEELFAAYRRRVADLQRQNPALTIVHFTAPLTGIENWKGWLRATVTGKQTARQQNAVRNRFNHLMREAYLGKEPLFDIARLESTLPDGRRVYFGAENRPVYILAPEHTDDGGHLNAGARRLVAEQLLITLARLAHTPQLSSREALSSAR